MGEAFINLKRFKEEHKAGVPVDMTLQLRVFEPVGLAFKVRAA